MLSPNFLELSYSFVFATIFHVSLFFFSAEAGIALLYISSDYVFDGTKPPYTENCSPNPLNVYGKTKLQGEIVVQESSKGMK